MAGQSNQFRKRPAEWSQLQTETGPLSPAPLLGDRAKWCEGAPKIGTVGNFCQNILTLSFFVPL